MDNLTTIEKQQLKALVKSAQFPTFERFIDLLRTRWQTDSSIRDTEWETTKAFLLKEGRVEGLKSLIQEMYKLLDE